MLGACISLKEREDEKKAGTMAAPSDALRSWLAARAAADPGQDPGNMEKAAAGSRRTARASSTIWGRPGQGLPPGRRVLPSSSRPSSASRCSIIDMPMALELKQRYDDKAPDALPAVAAPERGRRPADRRARAGSR